MTRGSSGGSTDGVDGVAVEAVAVAFLAHWLLCRVRGVCGHCHWPAAPRPDATPTNATCTSLSVSCRPVAKRFRVRWAAHNVRIHTTGEHSSYEKPARRPRSSDEYREGYGARGDLEEHARHLGRSAQACQICL